jgi:hypothetical protein
MAQSSVRRALRVLLFLMTLIAAAYVQAMVPVLQWDANPDTSTIGYRVYTGPYSRAYTDIVDVGPQTSLPLTNFEVGVTRFFTVIAYDANNTESTWSEEVWYTPPADGTSSAWVPSQLTAFSTATLIEFSGRAGQRCSIVASFNLSEWWEIFSTTLFHDQWVAHVDAGGVAQPMRFYRVVATPP